MNPTGFSTNSTSPLQNPISQPQFFPQMEANPGHLYGPSNPNPVWDLWASQSHNPAVFSASSSVYSAGYQQLSLYSGGGEGSGLNPDPHLVCLKLGKRQYFGDNFPAREGGVAVGKRSCVGASAVPRCQVEGCHVSLTAAKDYHRRHKVCEVHSKAPVVVVLGLQQRFCQQCSRFHVVSEFDESKRSCRRRLAGHNQRRRKSSVDSLPRNSSHEKVSGKLTKEGALSLLSTKASSWDINASSPLDISSRSSAALRELIAENRAAILSKNLHHNYPINQGHQLPHDYQSYGYNYHQFLADQSTSDWERQTVTLDLMQAPNASAFGVLSGSRDKNKGDEVGECDVLWNAWNGVDHD